MTPSPKPLTPAAPRRLSSLVLALASLASLVAVTMLLWPSAQMHAGTEGSTPAWSYDEFSTLALQTPIEPAVLPVSPATAPIEMEAPAAGPRPAPPSAYEACLAMPSPDGAVEDCAALRQPAARR